MAALGAESQSWETEEIQLLSYEVEETQKLYLNVDHFMVHITATLIDGNKKNNEEKTHNT